MSSERAERRVTASKALFFLVAATSWIFLPGPSGVEFASASSSSSSVGDRCPDELASCNEDSTCSTCLGQDNDGVSTVDGDCVTDMVGESSSETCPAVDAVICCTEFASGIPCFSDAEYRALVVCFLESYYECSADDMSCLDSSSGVSRSTPNVVVAGSLGVLVTTATILYGFVIALCCR